MEPLHYDTSFEGTSPFRGHKIWSRRNVHIIFVSVTSIEGTPLFRGKGRILRVPKRGFNLHSGDTLAIKKWLSLSAHDECFQKWINSLKSMYCTSGNSTHNIAEIHDLFALSNCLREPTPFSALAKIFCLLVFFFNKPQPTFIQVTLAL